MELRRLMVRSTQKRSLNSNGMSWLTSLVCITTTGLTKFINAESHGPTHFLGDIFLLGCQAHNDAKECTHF